MFKRVGHLQSDCRHNPDVVKHISKESKASAFRKRKRSSKIKKVEQDKF